MIHLGPHVWMYHRFVCFSILVDRKSSIAEDLEGRECQAFPYERRDRRVLSISSTNFSNALHFFASLHTSDLSSQSPPWIWSTDQIHTVHRNRPPFFSESLISVVLAFFFSNQPAQTRRIWSRDAVTTWRTRLTDAFA